MIRPVVVTTCSTHCAIRGTARWRGQTNRFDPSPTSAGVLGMARTMRSLPSHCARLSLRIPAATLRCKRTQGKKARLAPPPLSCFGVSPPTPPTRLVPTQGQPDAKVCTLNCAVLACCACSFKRLDHPNVSQRACLAESGRPQWRWPCCRRR